MIPVHISAVIPTALIALLTADLPAQTAAPFERRNDAERRRNAAVLPAMSSVQIEAGLKSRARALYIKEGWIRDPFIKLGPDDFYYLTGTTPNPGDPRER